VVPKRIEMLEGLIKQGKVQTAAKSAKAIIARDPRNAEAHYLLGQAYLADHKSELALMEYKTVNQIGSFGPTIPETDSVKPWPSCFFALIKPKKPSRNICFW